MSLNQIFAESDRLSLPVPAGIKAGDPVRVGIMNGVAETDRGDLRATGTGGAQRSDIPTSNAATFASVCRKGIYRLTVQATAAGVAGDPVYIKSDNTLTLTATSNKLFGALTRAMASGTSPVLVAIVPSSV